MQGKRIIQSLKLTEFLSFGSKPQEIELQPLNVLIGPNASGKSNFIEAFRILNAAPENVDKPISEGGGIIEYLWKGNDERAFSISTTIHTDNKTYPLDYGLILRSNPSGMTVIRREFIKPVLIEKTPSVPEYLYQSEGLRGEIYTKEFQSATYVRNEVSISAFKSILSQYKNPWFLELSQLQDVFLSIHFYTGWNLGRFGVLRYPQRADLPSTTLLENGSNLGLVLINKPASVRQQITERLKAVLPTVEEIFPKVEGGAVPLYIREKGFNTPIPAARLSEGTLRYLCLLTLLLDPTPPPIICLEEPEAGLHPHVVSQIAELLIDASQRTQLIVTTHSDALISGLSECPEAIITCERDDEGTKLRRLDPEQIKPWLDRYALGDLWRMGEIGGVR